MKSSGGDAPSVRFELGSIVGWTRWGGELGFVSGNVETGGICFNLCIEKTGSGRAHGAWKLTGDNEIRGFARMGIGNLGYECNVELNWGRNGKLAKAAGGKYGTS